VGGYDRSSLCKRVLLKNLTNISQSNSNRVSLHFRIRNFLHSKLKIMKSRVLVRGSRILLRILIRGRWLGGKPTVMGSSCVLANQNVIINSHAKRRGLMFEKGVKVLRIESQVISARGRLDRIR